MIWTWKDIKLASLQKMFAAEGTTIPNDESVTDYIASMPQACNEALSILSRVGKYVIKSVKISHYPIPNMITNPQDIQLLTEPYEVEMENAKSYFFEYSGTGTLKIYDGELLLDTVDLSSEDYTEYRDFVPTGVDKIKFVFTPTYPLNISNLAFYPVTFAEASKIPAYMDCTKYNLLELAPDFHTMTDVYMDGVNTKYMQTSLYHFEGEHTLVLRTDKPGNYLIYYRSFPQMITTTTLDTYEFDLPSDMMLLIPVYIASELYKEDDLAIATSYRNEFEVELSRLSEEANQAPSGEKFESRWV